MQGSWFAEQLRLFTQQELLFTQHKINPAVINREVQLKRRLELKPGRRKLKFEAFRSLLEKENLLFLVILALLRKEKAMLKEG